MNALLAQHLDTAVLLFCRVSAFIMVLPGFSSLRIAMRVRLGVALVVSFALMPLLPGGIAATPLAIGAEMLTGLVMGLSVRVLFGAFSFAATAVATFIGLAGMPGVPLESEEGQTPLAALITLTATALVFATGLHGALIVALADSHAIVPQGVWPQPHAVLNAQAAHLGDAFLLVLRLAMPFLIYAVIVNLAIGLANKMSPQIPVYFISMPFVVGGGLIVFAMLGPDMVSLFSAAASDAVRSGAGWR